MFPPGPCFLTLLSIVLPSVVAPPLQLKGALLLDRSIRMGVLFIHLGAFIELYWGNRGAGPFGVEAQNVGLNTGFVPNLVEGVAFHLRAFTSCRGFTMLMALLFRS